MNIIELYCDVDDFCPVFLPAWRNSLLPGPPRKRQRTFMMSPAEVMSLLILFQSSSYRNFKHYYTQHVVCMLKQAFPKRVSYTRFIELAQWVLIPLCAYLHTRRITSRGIACVDATPIRVCHHRRISPHRTFKGIAQWGKDSVD